MDELVSRQAAIDAICKACANGDDYVECVERRPGSTFCDEIVALRNLLSAHPSYSCDGCKTPKHICGICMRNYPDHYCTGEA